MACGMHTTRMFSLLLVTRSFILFYTSGTGNYYKMTYCEWLRWVTSKTLRRWASELMVMVRRQEERRAKVAGTHVIADENFDRRASRGRARDLTPVTFPRCPTVENSRLLSHGYHWQPLSHALPLRLVFKLPSSILLRARRGISFESEVGHGLDSTLRNGVFSSFVEDPNSWEILEIREKARSGYFERRVGGCWSYGRWRVAAMSTLSMTVGSFKSRIKGYSQVSDFFSYLQSLSGLAIVGWKDNNAVTLCLHSRYQER